MVIFHAEQLSGFAYYLFVFSEASRKEFFHASPSLVVSFSSYHSDMDCLVSYVWVKLFYIFLHEQNDKISRFLIHRWPAFFTYIMIDGRFGSYSYSLNRNDC